MIKIRILVPERFAGFDLQKAPGPTNLGSGVGIKYARVEEAAIDTPFECKRIYNVDQAHDADILFAEWLWFVHGHRISLDEQAKAFLSVTGIPKVIYGTELCVLGWSRQILARILQKTTIVTHNTQYQRQLYRTLGIYNSRFLSDPVPEARFFPATEKKRQLVCMGQISDAKRSHCVAEIFERLKNSGVTTVYIGGATVWGDVRDKKEHDLHLWIASVADEFYENIPEYHTAGILNQSAFYAHVACHDVSSIGQQENGSAGNVNFALTHPLNKERTPYIYQTPAQIADAIEQYPFESEQHENDMLNILTVADQWSYAAWQNQLQDLMRFIL